jgi:hypothetical protein
MLAASTTKKALIRRFEKEPLSGYVNPVSFLQDSGVEVLSAEGKVALLAYDEIKTISFVRNFEEGGDLERQVFVTRPKMEGLWVSFRFRDGAVMEGVMPNNLLQVEPHGFTVIPPDSYGNVQRIFVPRTAVQSVEVLGVVGSPLNRRKPKGKPEDQIGLFDQ